MRIFYIGFLLLLLSVELLSTTQPKKAKPVVHVLKIDTPLQVNVTSTPDKRDTIVIDASSSINTKSIEKSYKYWIAPLCGLLGVAIGFLLNMWRDSRTKKADRKQRLIDDLTGYKVKAARSIPDFKSHGIEAGVSSMQVRLWESVNSLAVLAGTINHDKRIEKGENKVELHSSKINDFLTEFREQVGHFERYMGENILFRELVEKLNNFNVSDLEVEIGTTVDMGDKMREKVDKFLTEFVNDVLQRFVDLMDLYIRTLAATKSDTQMKEFEKNVWLKENDLGGYFTTERPAENPS